MLIQGHMENHRKNFWFRNIRREKISNEKYSNSNFLKLFRCFQILHENSRHIVISHVCWGTFNTIKVIIFPYSPQFNGKRDNVPTRKHTILNERIFIDGIQEMYNHFLSKIKILQLLLFLNRFTHFLLGHKVAGIVSLPLLGSALLLIIQNILYKVENIFTMHFK